MVFVKTIVVSTLAAIFLGLAAPALAESTAFPSDVIESPAVKVADIPQHFKNVFGRDPSAGELKYWQTRRKDKPYQLEFLGAMGYWAAQGESPSVENRKFTIGFSGTGRDIFAGQTRRHTITVTHTNPVAQEGFLDVKVNINAIDIEPTAPFPNVQRTYTGGITRLRHRYFLEPNETLSVDFIITAPKAESYTVEGIVHGRGITKHHATKVYSVIPETLGSPTYQQRQIPIMFARVFGRTPTTTELAKWRAKLTKTHRLETIQGAMEVAKQNGTTLP